MMRVVLRPYPLRKQLPPQFGRQLHSAPRCHHTEFLKRRGSSMLDLRAVRLQKFQRSPYESTTGHRKQSSMSHYLEGTPPGVKNAKGLHLVTQSTPNGKAVQILLEELKDLYDIHWSVTLISIGSNVQKQDWFLKWNPNGRIPMLIDNTQNPPFSVMETSAELLYLEKFLDKDNTFGFKDELERSDCIQWIMFFHGSLAPYQGQVNHFTRAAPEKIPYAINRYRNEVLRVYGVLEIHLSGKYTGSPREYLAGQGAGKYSIADIKGWPWVQNWPNSGFTEEEMKEFPHLLKWIERVRARPAVQRGSGELYDPGNKDPVGKEFER